MAFKSFTPGPFAAKVGFLILIAGAVNLIPLIVLRKSLLVNIQSPFLVEPYDKPDTTRPQPILGHFAAAQQDIRAAAEDGTGQFGGVDATPTRLELLHIPKTGGSMLEVLAGNHHIRWGACHFRWQLNPLKPHIIRHMLKVPPWRYCPPGAYQFNTTTVLKNVPFLWHIPLHILPRYISFDPYDDFDAKRAAQPKKFFTVLRDPYEKVISLYYYANGGKSRKLAHDADAMNQFILTKIPPACDLAWKCLNSYTSLPFDCSGMWLCGNQYDYVYHGQKRMVDHLVHFETLFDDFEKLNQKYELGINVVPPKPDASKGAAMTVANMTVDAIRLVNNVFQKDFALGRGYRRIDVSEAAKTAPQSDQIDPLTGQVVLEEDDDDYAYSDFN